MSTYILTGMFPKGFEGEAAERFQQLITKKNKFAFVASDFEKAPEKTDEYFRLFLYMFGDIDIHFDQSYVVDGRMTAEEAQKAVAEADVVWLSGGDAPTQFRYLQEYGLTEVIKKHRGVIIGMSAGSINLAKTAVCTSACGHGKQEIYAGIGCVKMSVEPHFMPGNISDELLELSKRHEIYGLCDNSVIVCTKGKTEYCGQIYKIKNGKVHVVSGDVQVKEEKTSLKAPPKRTVVLCIILLFVLALFIVVEVTGVVPSLMSHTIKNYSADGSWQEIVYDAFGNEIKTSDYNADGNLTKLVEYDADGQKTKTIQYNEDGEFRWWYEYQHDDAGINYKTLSYDSDGNLIGWWEFEWGSNGYTLKDTKYNVNGNIELIYEYDDAGNKIKDIRYKEDGSLDYWSESEYDLSGNVIKFIRYGGNGIVSGWREYEYDDAGNMTKSVVCSCYEDGSLMNLYEYDGAGNTTKAVYYGEEGRILVWSENEYDEDGHKISMAGYDENGNIKYRDEFNAEGNTVKSTFYEANGDIACWTEFEYDSAGNIRKETNYNGDGSIDYWYEYLYNAFGEMIRKNGYDGNGDGG